MAADVEFGEKAINLSFRRHFQMSRAREVKKKCFTRFSVVVGTAMNGLWVIFLPSKLTLVCG